MNKTLLFVAVGRIFVALFTWSIIYTKKLPSILSNQENAPTLGPHHWNPSVNMIPTAKGQIETEKISMACFPVRLPSLVWYNWCIW